MSKLFKIIAGLIITCVVAHAAFFQGAVNGPSQIIMGVFKPTGTPTYVGSSSFPGVIFYGYDTGTGVYVTVQDTSPGAHPYDPTAWNNGSSQCLPGSTCGSGYDPVAAPTGDTMSGTMVDYGTAFIFPGTYSPPMTPPPLGGYGSYVRIATPDPIRTATNLSVGSSGDTFILACTFMMTSNPVAMTQPLICGRSYCPDPNYYQGAFIVDPSNAKLVFAWNTSSTQNCGSSPTPPATITSGSALSLNTIHTAIAVAWNASAPPGHVSINVYLDGSLMGSITGSDMYDVPFNNSNSEDQLMNAALIHIFGNGHSDPGFIGSEYQTIIATGNGVHTTWDSTTPATSLFNNPYQMLLHP